MADPADVGRERRRAEPAPQKQRCGKEDAMPRVRCVGKVALAGRPLATCERQ